jgi:hypothetical protein
VKHTKKQKTTTNTNKRILHLLHKITNNQFGSETKNMKVMRNEVNIMLNLILTRSSVNKFGETDLTKIQNWRAPLTELGIDGRNTMSMYNYCRDR